MKKLFVTTLIVLFSTFAQATEHTYNIKKLKPRPLVLTASVLAVSGILYTAVKSTTSPYSGQFGIFSELGYASVGTAAFGAATIVATAFIAEFEREELDYSQKEIKEYKKFKAKIKASLTMGAVAQDPQLIAVIKDYECIGCAREIDKLMSFNKVVKKVIEQATEFAKGEVYNEHTGGRFKPSLIKMKENLKSTELSDSFDELLDVPSHNVKSLLYYIYMMEVVIKLKK